MENGILDTQIINPKTKRAIKIGGPTHKILVAEGIISKESLKLNEVIQEAKDILSIIASRIDEIPFDIMGTIMTYLDYKYIKTLFKNSTIEAKILENENHRLWKLLVQRDLTNNFDLFCKNARRFQRIKNPIISEYTESINNLYKKENVCSFMMKRGYEKNLEPCLSNFKNPGKIDWKLIQMTAKNGHVHIINMLYEKGIKCLHICFYITALYDKIDIAKKIMAINLEEALNINGEINLMHYWIYNYIKWCKIETLLFLSELGYDLKIAYNKRLRTFLLKKKKTQIVEFMDSLCNSNIF